MWQNLKVFGHLYAVPGLKKKVNELLEHFQISHLKDRVTGRLSAGEATRVNLCKSLLNNPDLPYQVCSALGVQTVPMQVAASCG